MRLDWDGQRVRRATVRSSRPHALARVLAGRDVRDAAALLPRLYSVCAFAQGAAAASALGAADARACPVEVLSARSLAVGLEALQEDLRLLLIDLPTLVGADPCVGPVVAARTTLAPALAALRAALDVDAPGTEATPDPRTLGASLRALVAADVLGIAPEAFVALGDAAAFEAWARDGSTAPARLIRDVLAGAPRLGASAVRTMPEPSRAALERSLLAALDDDPGFARAPRWAGEPVETGALARRAGHPGLAAFVAAHGNGVAARLCARLLEVARSVVALAQGAIEPRVTAWSPRAGEGVASVHTARGLLVHRARVVAGVVRDYAIVAPTEWNFHPEGALVHGLEGLAADGAQVLARHANLVVQALDPCVACSVEIAHA